MWIVPLLSPGKAYFRELETSSVTMRPSTMARSGSRLTGSSAKSSRAEPL